MCPCSGDIHAGDDDNTYVLFGVCTAFISKGISTNCKCIAGRAIDCTPCLESTIKIHVKLEKWTDSDVETYCNNFK
jgi:hypothetical protein